MHLKGFCGKEDRQIFLKGSKWIGDCWKELFTQLKELLLILDGVIQFS